MNSWKTTVLGVLALLAALCQFGTSLLDDDPETVPNFQMVIEAAVGIGLILARDNDKTSEESGAKAKLKARLKQAYLWPVLIFVLAGLTLGGCVTTNFRETVTDETGVVTDTAYGARSAAWPFGKVDSSLHEMSYKWGGDENAIAVGQGAEGLDNTAMVDVIGALITLAPYLQSPAAQPSAVDQLLSNQALIDALAARIRPQVSADQ